jgi:hypothetical protein
MLMGDKLKGQYALDLDHAIGPLAYRAKESLVGLHAAMGRNDRTSGYRERHLCDEAPELQSLELRTEPKNTVVQISLFSLDFR